MTSQRSSDYVRFSSTVFAVATAVSLLFWSAAFPPAAAARNLNLSDVDLATCSNGDHECLYAFVDAYLDALVARDPSRLPVGPDLKFTQNDTVLHVGEGLWRRARAIGSYQIYAADTKTGEAGFMGVVITDDMASMFALRLRISQHRITEIETIVPGKTIAGVLDGRMEKAPAKLVTARPGYRVALKPAERVSRRALRGAADSYYDGVEQGDGNIVAFSHKCHRIEDGIPLVNNPNIVFPPMVSESGRKLPDFAAMGCRRQFNTRIWSTDSISDRRYPLIDEQYGIVFVYTLYHRFSKGSCVDLPGHGQACAPRGQDAPATLALVEAFKIRRGKVHEMESIWSVLPDNRIRSQW